jgi:hypothetical protein
MTNIEDIMNPLRSAGNGYKSRLRTNTLQLFRWTGAWLVTLALMTFGPKFLWNRGLVLTLLALALNVGVGIGMIASNKKFIMEQDELQRAIMLNAMGITLGIGLIAGIPFSVMSAYHVIPFKADSGYLLMLMSLAYVACIAYGHSRYK